MGKKARLLNSSTPEWHNFWSRHIARFCYLNGCAVGEIRKGTPKEDMEKAIDYAVSVDKQHNQFSFTDKGKTIQSAGFYVQAKGITNRNDFQLTADYQKRPEKWERGLRVPTGDIQPAWGVLPKKTRADEPHFFAFGFPDHRPKGTNLDIHKEWTLSDCVLWIEYNHCIETIKTNLEQWKKKYGCHDDMGEPGRERTWCVFFPAEVLWRLCCKHSHSVITFGMQNTGDRPSWMEKRTTALVTTKRVPYPRALKPSEYEAHDRKHNLHNSERVRTMPRCEKCGWRFGHQADYRKKNSAGQMVCDESRLVCFSENLHF